MPVERRGQAIDIGSGQPGSGQTDSGRNSMFNGRRQPSHGGTSRMMREYQVRICERLGVKFLGPTRLVSRVTPVHTAMRNCMRDEGGPFGIGNQVLISSHPQAAVVKSHGGERCGKTGTRFRPARLREASASKPPVKCRKAIGRCQNRGLTLPPRSAWEMPETAQAASGM